MIFDFSRIKNSKNLLAFSGGVDSSALFFLLLNHKIDFDIAIVNYNTREQSKDEIEYALNLAKEYKKEIFIKDVKLENSSNFEKNARDIRYIFFEQIIKENSYETLITAHQLNDRLEWFLMQLSKGAGLVELFGIREFEEKKDYKILPENSITLNSDRFAERKEFLIMSKKNKYGYEPIISNFVGYQKIAKLNFENDDQVEISLNSFEIYENPDGKGIHGRSYVTLLKNKEYISKDKKITEMYNHDVVYAEDISNFQIVADIITERFIQLDIKIKNVEYFNSDIKFVKVWEGNLCM